MAWFIERLLTNSEKIHLGDRESDMHGYLLTLENKAKELVGKGLFTKDEILLLNELMYGKTITQLGKEQNLSRVTTAMKIDALTDKLSMYLGGIYTDEGFLKYMQKTYKLTDKQVTLLEEKIKGNYKRFYLR
ncbi:MAG: hypothetical protein ACTSWJ_13115 [Candidatus Heimdallarchaeaceae archaeon]